MSKSNRSRGSQFLHDLITVDFGKVDIYYGVRVATIIAPLLVLGVITRQVGDSSLTLSFRSLIRLILARARVA
jgi:hypothetical protein